MSDDVTMQALFQCQLQREADAKRIEELGQKVHNLTRLLDEQMGTPCGQIRWQQEREELEAEKASLRQRNVIQSSNLLVIQDCRNKAEARAATARDDALEEAAKEADELYDEAPSHPFDNGGTQDGWQSACVKIATAIRALKGTDDGR